MLGEGFYLVNQQVSTVQNGYCVVEVVIMIVVFAVRFKAQMRKIK